MLFFSLIKLKYYISTPYKDSQLYSNKYSGLQIIQSVV